MTDINELAQRAAERFGVDGEAAVGIARTYLKQAAEAVGDDPQLIDEDDLTDEQIDSVMTAIKAEMGNAHAADERDLTELVDLRDRIALLQEHIARLARERDILQRRPANSSSPVVCMTLERYLMRRDITDPHQQIIRLAEERDRIVRRLLANAVVPVKDVAEAAGLPLERIYQIREGKR